MRDFGEYLRSSGIGIPNDSATSVKVGSNAQVRLCEHAYFGGDCEVLRRNDKSLSNNTVGNDRVTSMLVQQRGASNACIPADDQVSIYIHVNYKGSCQILDVGAYSSSKKTKLPNDSISSVRVGANVQAVVCRDAHYLGHCAKLTTSKKQFPVDGIGNDEITSIKVQPKGTQPCQPGPGSASFFVHSNFLGECVNLSMGEYASTGSIGLPNDSISSFLLGDGVKVAFCKHSSFRVCTVRMNSDENLHNDRWGDRISSIRVLDIDAVDCPNGADEASFFTNRHFLRPCRTLGIGDYDGPQEFGLPNNQISSVRTGSQVQACLCTGRDFSATCEIITGEDTSLSDNEVMNNRVSSLRVQPLGSSCEAQSPPPVDYESYGYIVAFNCHANDQDVTFWLLDETAGFWEEVGGLPGQTILGECPSNEPPLIIPLSDGHWYRLVATDRGETVCNDRDGDGELECETRRCEVEDPEDIRCQRFVGTGIVGEADGPPLPIVVH